MKMLYFRKLSLDERSGFTDECSADKDTVKHLNEFTSQEWEKQPF